MPFTTRRWITQAAKQPAPTPAKYKKTKTSARKSALRCPKKAAKRSPYVGMRAEQAMSGNTSMVVRRSRGSRRMRVAPMAGTAHACDMSSGTNARPDRPIARSTRSTKKAPRARYPVASSTSRTTVRITIWGMNTSTVPAPAKIPRTKKPDTRPSPSQRVTSPPRPPTSASMAVVTGSATRNTAANASVISDKNATGPRSGCKSTRSSCTVRCRRFAADLPRTSCASFGASSSRAVDPLPSCASAASSTAARAPGSRAESSKTFTPRARSSTPTSTCSPRSSSRSFCVATTTSERPSARSSFVSRKPSASCVTSSTCTSSASGSSCKTRAAIPSSVAGSTARWIE